MSLRVKCRGCRRVLSLDDSFAGAVCRCRHCRALTDVPRSPSRIEAARNRPEQPPLAASTGRVAGQHASLPTSSWTRHRRFIAIASLFSSAAVIAVIVWMATGDDASGSRFDDLASAGAAVVSAEDGLPGGETLLGQDEGPMATRDASINTFCDIPAIGRTIAFVFDRHESMTPYMDKLAFMTRSTAAKMVTHGQARFGVVASSADWPLLSAPRAVTKANVIAATSILYGGFSRQPTDLVKAVRPVADWRADQLFLVLARPVRPDRFEALLQRLQETGARTDIVALGPAARNSGDLARLARATGGVLMALGDDRFAAIFRDVQASSDSALQQFEKEPG